jgi:hypothetical protein
MTSLLVPPQSRNWSSSDAEAESKALEHEMDGVPALKPTTLSCDAGGRPSAWAGAGVVVGDGAGAGLEAASARLL